MMLRMEWFARSAAAARDEASCRGITGTVRSPAWRRGAGVGAEAAMAPRIEGKARPAPRAGPTVLPRYWGAWGQAAAELAVFDGDGRERETAAGMEKPEKRPWQRKAIATCHGSVAKAAMSAVPVAK